MVNFSDGISLFNIFYQIFLCILVVVTHWSVFWKKTEDYSVSSKILYTLLKFKML